MSDLLNKASLVMVPSGYKEDTVYSVVPTDGSGDLSFTRASNGTRVNSAGLVEVCPWNLAQYSEDFTNAAWTASNATITSNSVVAPNGTTTADTITGTTIGSEPRVRQIITQNGSSVYAFSCYAKKGNVDWFILRNIAVNLAGGSRAWFNLNTGTVGTTNSGVSATIESVGNGWYRCTIYGTTDASPTQLVDIAPAPADNDFTTNASGENVYIWGAQLNIGSTAKPYFPTTDRLNVPRLTYQNGGGGCPSLLLEPQRTNLCLQSQDFANASWTKATVTLTANYSTSPDGSTNATRIVPTGGTGSGYFNRVYRPIDLSSSATYTMSVWAKSSASSPKMTLAIVNIAGQVFSITNTWQRYTLQFTGAGLASNFNIYAGDVSWATGVTNSTNEIEIYGAQLEQGAYPTTYIPTTSATATRVADACFKTGIGSLIGSTSGAMFMEIDNSNPSAYLGTAPNNTIFGSINSGDYLNNFHFNTDNTKLYVYCNASGGALQAAIGVNMPTTPKIKMAVTYTSSAIKFFVNGSLIGTDTSFTLPSSMSRVDVGHMGGQPDSQRMRGSVNEFLLFTTALTDAEAIALTTL